MKKHKHLRKTHTNKHTQYTQANIRAHVSSPDVKTRTNTPILTRAQIHSVPESTHTGVCPPGLACRGTVGEGPCVRAPQLSADLGGGCVSRPPPSDCVRMYLPGAGLGQYQPCCISGGVGAKGGKQSPPYGVLRVPQTSCLALEPHLGLALVVLPGKA